MGERFPRLVPDDPSECPCPLDDILKYLEVESAGMTRPELTFLRTADVGATKFWLWTFDDGGCPAYFAYSKYKEGGLLSTAQARVSAEEYIKRIDDEYRA